MFGWLSFLQTLIFTLFVIVVLQIKIGDSTLEQKTIRWYRTSEIAAPLQGVAEGGARLVRDLVNTAADSLNLKVFDDIKNRPGTRDLGLRIERSKEFVEDKARRAAQKLQRELGSKTTLPPQEGSAAPQSQSDWE